MAFALPRIFSRRLASPVPGTYAAAKPKPKPAYSPKTEQDITQAMFDLALAGPRWIGEQMGEDLDEAFEVGDTRVSITEFIRHPIKTTKSTIRKWTVSRWKNAIRAELVAEYVWKPRLEHFKTQGKIDADEYDFILEKWAEKPEGFARDEGFERLEELHKHGFLDDDVWQGIHRQHQWDEFSRFRRSPGRYAWEKLFGKRGHLGEAPFYKYSPQKWLGEPLGKVLAKTALGKAIAGIREAAKKVAQKVVEEAKRVLRGVVKVGARVVEKAVVKVAGQATWTAISSAIGGALGSAGGPVGAIIGFLAGPALTKLTEWLLKIACLGCGCAALGFVAFVAFVIVVVGAAFRPPEMGGGLGAEQLVQVVKTANPDHVDLVPAGQPNPIVEYTISFENLTDGDLTDVILKDDYDQDNFTPSGYGGGTIDPVNGTLTWNIGTLGPSGGDRVEYDGFVKANDGVDKIVTNTVTLTAKTAEGEEVSDTAMASVIVGEPVGQPPSGWPTDSGCITQGPNTVDSPGENDASHEGQEAIDIGAPAGQSIYATHDGEVFSTYWNGTNIGGNYIVILSPEGFKTLYAHLLSINPMLAPDKCPVYVEKGQLLGTVGNTGDSTGPHLHYEFIGRYQGQKLKLEPPYIPSAINSCLNKVECDCCFNGRDELCSSYQ